MKKISIIIPYYKKKKYFKETLDSVLNQTYKNFEIIIIYDDTEKQELEILKKLISNKKKIKLLINKKNIGAGMSRNKGIKHASGDYLSFIDADDLWKKNKLKYQINYMTKNKLDFTHTSYKIIDLNNRMIGSVKVKKILDYNSLLKSCDIGLSTVLLKTNILKKKYKFNNFKTKEDFSLWLKLSKNNHKIVGINKMLTYWRNTPDSLSSSLFQKLFDAFKLYYIEEKFSLINSLFKVLVLSLNAIKKN